MGYLPSCSYVPTDKWMHHTNTNKTHTEKARWKLNKNAACCLAQILIPTRQKTAAVRPPNSLLRKHSIKTKKYMVHCLKSKVLLISNVDLWNFAHGRVSMSRPEKMYSYKLSADVGYSLEDLPGEMADRDNDVFNWNILNRLFAMIIFQYMGKRALINWV